MKKLTLSLAALMAISTFATAETFDADGPNSYKERYGDGSFISATTKRQGFRLGLGIGAGNLSVDTPEDFSEFGVATSFEIGYAFTNQFSVNYLNNVTWASGEGYYGDDSYLGGFTGVSMNYYIHDKIETPYVVAGIGLSSFRLSDDFSNVDTGTGYLVGIGYAMGNIEIEANYIFGEIDDTPYGDGQDMDAFQVTISYLFY